MNSSGVRPFIANLGINHASSFTSPPLAGCPAFACCGLASGHMGFTRKTLSWRKTDSHNHHHIGWQCKKHKHGWRQTTWCAVTESAVEEKKSAATVLMPRTRRLILLRHAKSSWGDPSLRDHERPLSKHGRLDAASIAVKLRQLGWLPELILSSDAKRTRQTLQIMQEHVRDFLKAEVHFIPSFYSVAAMDGQTAQHLQEAVCQYSRDDMLTVMCMGHNRGWEEAASVFSGVPVELKTSNAAVLETHGKSWEEAFSAAGFGCWKLIGIIKPD